MKTALIAAALALTVTTAAAQPSPDPIAGAERAFDAYTHAQGFTHGFHAWSAPGALLIGPGGAQPIHERLGEAIAKDPSEADAPSLLRWWPGYTGLSTAGDLGYDYGGWTNGDAADCGSDRSQKPPKTCGLYFTIWQKQADGSWKWVMDTGAGPDYADGLPPKGRLIAHLPDEPSPAPTEPATAATEVADLEARLNSALAVGSADDAYKGLISNGAIIADGVSVPARYLIDYDMALAVRPTALVWNKDRQSISKSGDMAWTTGHSEDATGAVKGYYVRVWQRFAPSSLMASAGNAQPYWALAADIYHAAQ